MSGAFGEHRQVPLLVLARLIIGADPAVDGDVSQSDPQKCLRFERSQIRALRMRQYCAK